jgi:hypothetical protein
MANQLQTTCDNLWSIVAGRRLGCGPRSASPAFVGCISGLGGGRRLEDSPLIPFPLTRLYLVTPACYGGHVPN